MVTEDYISFDTAKLLKKKGFNWNTDKQFNLDKIVGDYNITDRSRYPEKYLDAPTLQMAMKWLREKHDILLIVDYDYECTGTPYCYKIYRLGEYGKPERVAVKGVSYDKYDNPTTHIVGWRDYERSYKDYGTYEDACEAGIKYCLNLI